MAGARRVPTEREKAVSDRMVCLSLLLWKQILRKRGGSVLDFSIWTAHKHLRLKIYKTKFFALTHSDVLPLWSSISVSFTFIYSDVLARTLGGSSLT